MFIVKAPGNGMMLDADGRWTTAPERAARFSNRRDAERKTVFQGGSGAILPEWVVRVPSGRATKADLRREIRELRVAGYRLSCAAYNLCQQGGKVLDQRSADRLKELYEGWDAVGRSEPASLQETQEKFHGRAPGPPRPS